MATFAKNTDVASDRSRAEIERTLVRYGAGSFMYGWNHGSAQVGFEMKGRRIKFVLPLPNRNDKEFTRTPTNKARVPSQIEKAFEQAVRQRWRALALVIKAKLEAVEAGIAVFDEEFMAHIMLPNGHTVGEWMVPQIETAYNSGNMPPLLEGPR